jgi:hypothetical protein
MSQLQRSGMRAVEHRLSISLYQAGPTVEVDTVDRESVMLCDTPQATKIVIVAGWWDLLEKVHR